MSETTIQWTDKTWNPVTGCSKVSQGCKNCYAERIWPRVYGKFRPFTDVRCHDERLRQPQSWKKPCRVFVNSMSDLFHESVPFDFIDKVVLQMIQSDHHTYQILTKRAERALEYFRRSPYNVSHPRMQWGVSIENQDQANRRIPVMLRWPGVGFRWVSIEPQIGEINLDAADDEWWQSNGIKWVVIGGESGPNARPFEIGWARNLVQQCKSVGVPVFIKQLGKRPVSGVARELIALNDSHGGNMDEWPEDLRIREYPA